MKVLAKIFSKLLMIAVTSILWISASYGGKAGEAVPPFSLQSLDGELVSLEDYRGEVVMINFWATYCAPCIEELPSMQALLESFSDRPFTILAVNMGEDPKAISSFMDRIGADFDFPLLLDPTMEVASDYRVSALPATLLVDTEGKHAFGGVGARDWNSEEARNQILPLFPAESGTN